MGNPFIFGETDFTIGFADPMFSVQCTTVMELFLLGGVLLWALTNPSCMPNLNSLSSAVADILKGDPKYSGNSLDQGIAHFFLWV